MNVNMNVSTRTTSKKLDIINSSSKTEQFKKVLDNHELRFRNLTNENAQKKCMADENTISGIEKAIAYGGIGINLNDSEDTTELKAKIIEFIEIAIDAAKQNPVNIDGELRSELISFIQTAVDGLKQTPENLSKNSHEKEGDNVSVLQIQQILQSLSSIFETQQNVSQAKSKEISFNSIDLEKILDDNVIDVENLTPQTKDKLKNNLSKIFKLIGKSDTNKDVSLQIQNVLQSLSSMFETQQSVSEPQNEVSNLKSVDLEKMIDDNLIGVENLTPDVKNTLKNDLAKIFALIDKSDTNTDESLPIQNVLEKLITEVSGVKEETSKPQIKQILQSLSSIFENQQSVSEPKNKVSNLKPVDLKKMLDDHLEGVENLTTETKDILKDSLTKIFTLIEKPDSIASKPQIQQRLQALSLMFESKQSVSKSEAQESNLKPVDLEKMLNENTIGVENLSTEMGEVKGDLSLLTKDTINVQEAEIQQILQSLSSMFQNDHSVSMTENKQWDLSSINVEQLIGVENLTPETKNMLKKSFSEIIVLIEKLETSVEGPSKTLQVLQKITTEVHKVKGDLSLLKIPSTQNVIVNSEVRSIKDNHKSSFEEKFLSNLISSDKDEMKISKAVNFMNQFQETKNLNTGKVEAPNLIVDKNNFTVDIIKSMKFMETNNIKNLTVTMSPKELGEITIKLTMESGVMKAFISAQNKDTFNLLNSNMQDISDKLKNMDIKIQSLDINIYEDSTFFSKESNKKNNNQKQTNDSKANSGLEEKEDVLIRDNYAIEQNAVNKFV